MGQERLYVSGLWHVPSNCKRDPAHYRATFARTMAMLRGHRLVFLSDDDGVLIWAQGLARDHGVDLKPALRPVESLPNWGTAAALTERCREMALDAGPRPAALTAEKGLVHYWRDYMGSGARAYRRIVTIWTSKVPLLAECVEQARQGDIAWIDASAARFNGRRTSWDFTRVPVPEGRIAHYGNQMTYLGQRLPLNASFLCGTVAAIGRLAPAFEDALQAATRQPYAHDEETILGAVHQRQPALFETVGHPLETLPRGKSGRGGWSRVARGIARRVRRAA